MERKQGRFTSFFIKDIIANDGENQLEIRTRLQGEFPPFHKIFIELKSYRVLCCNESTQIQGTVQASMHFGVFDSNRLIAIDSYRSVAR